jgi:acetone carboxylase gamma subunit
MSDYIRMVCECGSDTFRVSENHVQWGHFFEFVCTECGHKETREIEDPTYEG